MHVFNTQRSIFARVNKKQFKQRIFFHQGTFKMFSTDLVAELRAEVTCWCKKLREKHDQSKQDKDSTKIGPSVFSSPGSSFSPFSSLTPPFRLISQGHELTPELDEKSLGEMGFKDLQVVSKDS